MRYFVTLPGGVEIPVDVNHLPTGRTRVSVRGKTFDADTILPGHESLDVIVDGKVVDFCMEGAPPDVGIVARGHRFYARVESERMRALSSAAGGGRGGASDSTVTSPMPGRVLKVLVAEGDEVAAGAPLVVVEAMKMENELCAGHAGKVLRVHVKAGDTVEGGAALVELS